MKTKKTFFSFYLSACTLLLGGALMTACSSDDLDEGAKGVDMVKGMQIELAFADYGEDTESTMTRAAAATPAKDTVVLGNGLVAEISVERDAKAGSEAPAKPATRALSAGTYTMAAYQGGVFKGDVTGTVSGSVFTPTSSNPAIILTPGTYDFVCYNEFVSRNGNELTVAQADAGKALIGRAANQRVSGARQKIRFTMNHVGARMRVKLTSYVSVHDSIKAKVADTDGDAPVTAHYDMSTGTYTYANGALTPGEYAFGESKEWARRGYFAAEWRENYTSLSDYQYFLPSTEGAKLKLTFSQGTLYYKDVAGVTIPVNPDPAITMKQNGSYTVNVKMLYDFYYLYSDGTTDRISAAAGRTPVGVVVSRSQRLAAALKEAGNGNWCQSSYQLNLANSQQFPTPAQALNDMAGEDWTWDAAHSHDGQVKANESVAFPAFYKAAHYDAGTTLSGGLEQKRWFLPSAGQMKYLFTGLGKGDIDPVIAQTAFTNATHFPWKGDLANAAFVQLGGSSIYDSGGKAFFTSTEVDYQTIVMVSTNPEYMRWTEIGKPSYVAILPFVNY
ncbi:fimbrillin family protein [Prevotella sp. KH2C16]|uniref:fimbrillin family protein n=1 Tax=Prevotella sp. KH2C16 TaxID=1855325 RepID=UPI0008E7F145|nr:fimbrillin family protein [Prevotella sp. KH2C16]SFG78466.1 hypothetical protein SAMN05216383_1511 [Prevotella sp. KH2C16]